jgi:Ca2+-binding RTX toxin-like protein
VLFSTISVEQRGTDANDRISGVTDGVSSNNILNGMGGNDALHGNAGNDTYIFSEGVDTIFETTGTDTLRFWQAWEPGDITVYRQKVSSSGWDDLVFADGDGNMAVVKGHFDGKELEYATFHDSTQWDILSMSVEVHGTASGEQISGLEAGNHVIRALGGNDQVIVGSGNQYIEAGDGDDYVSAGHGNDEVHGGNGADDIRGGNDADTLYGDDGNDSIQGEKGDDVIYGGAGNDTLYGGITTASGTYAGSDELHGGDGDDTLYGGNGNDTLYGDDGLDTLYGDGGVDTFVFEAASAFNDVDVIGDFNAAQDIIDITDLLTAYDPMNDLLTDFVQITDDGTHSTLAVDADGGADNFMAVASILNTTGLTDENALVSSGTLLAA